MTVNLKNFFNPKVKMSKMGEYQELQPIMKQGLIKNIPFMIEGVKHYYTVAGINGGGGWDEDNNNTFSCIDFNRIKGGKPFDTTLAWYTNMIQEINAI